MERVGLGIKPEKERRKKMKGLRFIITAICAFGLILTIGCAKKPEKISAAYVSPLKYKDYDCDQIAMEMDYVSKRTTELYNQIEKTHNKDAVAMGVGLVLFWPALFLIEGNGPEATEYSQLKGEYEALRQAAIAKKCQMENLPPSPEEIINSKKQEAQKQK